MSYIIRSYASWFLHVGLVVGGGLLLFVGGCDTGMELTGERPVEPLRATPYEAIANKQYEALTFIDSYVDGAVERSGKRPDRTEMKALIVEAQAELMAQEGYGPEEIAQVKDQLGPHLERPRRVDDSQSLSTILTKQGFSPAQKRYIRRIEVATRSAASYSSLQKSLRTIVQNSKKKLAAQDAAAILSLSARFEGFARFLHHVSIRTFGLPSAPAVVNVTGKIPRNANCPGGPRPRDDFHQEWKYWSFGIGTGLAFCGGAGSLTFYTGWGAVGACIAGFDFGFGAGAYWAYKNAEEDYLTALYAWCGECIDDKTSSASGVQQCLIEFPDQYHDRDNDIPYHHRDETVKAKTE